jgi:hypothetical protein
MFPRNLISGDQISGDLIPLDVILGDLIIARVPLSSRQL